MDNETIDFTVSKKAQPPGVNIPFQAGSARAVKSGGAAAAAAFAGYILMQQGVLDAEGLVLFIPVATGFFAGLEKWLRERQLWA